jgi:hypothetical protein
MEGYAPVPHALATGAFLGGDAAALGARPLLLLAPLGRHRVCGRAVAVVIVVGGGEPRGVDVKVARGCAAHGDDGRREEHEPDHRRLDHRREVQAKAASASGRAAPSQHLISPAPRVRVPRPGSTGTDHPSDKTKPR